VIPQGIGWQQLRSTCLDAIPAGSGAYHTRAMPLQKWRVDGSFTVQSCDKRGITLEAAGVEIGAALLADVEHLLDHSAEHNACIHDALTLGNWSSPAWTTVTAYYWAFFSVLALTRLNGRSAWFLDRGALSNFRTLAGASDQPGAGPFRLVVGPYTSATSRRIDLHPSRAQFHDSVWTVFHASVSEVFANCDRNTSPNEYFFWEALKRVGDSFGANWASKLRNTVNYRPGWGYREVIRSSQIDLVRRIGGITPASLSDIALAFNAELSNIPATADPAEDVKVFSRLLGLYALLISAIANTLHADVVSRQSGDQRWGALRARFLNERCATPSRTIWPFL
jgi:hypothetical protein